MNTIDTKKGVPGVPLAALAAIQDQNTRQVLQAIVDGWHVRNGSSGYGGSRFITAAELGDINGMISGIQSSVSQVKKDLDKPLSSGDINSIISDLESSVLESQLFKELGERITLINKELLDKLTAEAIARQAAITTEQTIRQTADTSLAQQVTTVTAAVGNNAAAIQNEVTARVNGDNAMAQQVSTQLATVNGNLSALQTQQTTTANSVAALSQSLTTLQATVGQNTIALQQESTVRLNADNDIYAKYSVKIDNNGYVTGFGLMSTSNNSTPFSEFIVRADRFAIGSPSGPGITPVVPFIVTTTTDSKGNPPGVYMRKAVIGNALIGTAQIDDLSVTTLKVAGEAINRVRHVNQFWSTTVPTSGTVTIFSTSYTVPAGTGLARLVAQVSTPLYVVAGNSVAVGLRLFIDGSQISDIGVTSDGNTHMICTAGAGVVWEGDHTVSVQLYLIPPWNGSAKQLSGVLSVVMHGALR